MNISQSKNNITLLESKAKLTSKIKPKYYRLLGQVLNSHFDSILNYLDVTEVSVARGTSQMFLALIHVYLPKRLRLEVERIRMFQDENYENLFNYMKIIDSQIPVSNNNWLDFNLPSVVEKLKLLDKNTLVNLKSIKILPSKIPETVFAPFCLIMGLNVSKIMFLNSH